MSDGNEKLYDFKARSDEAGLLCEDPSLTVQSDSIDADINTIVYRYGITGRMPDNIRLPSYQDYDEVFDFSTAQRRVLDAEDEFMRIPADVRARFSNDPAQFFNYATNPANYDGLVELGLAKARSPDPALAPVPVPVPAATPTA